MQASVRVSVRARVWAAHLVARHGEEVLLDLLLQLGEAGLLLHFEAQECAAPGETKWWLHEAVKVRWL